MARITSGISPVAQGSASRIALLGPRSVANYGSPLRLVLAVGSC